MSIKNFFIYVTDILSPITLISVCALALLYVFAHVTFKKIFVRYEFAKNPDWVHAFLIVTKSTILAGLLVIPIKAIFKIPRPPGMMIMETGYGFLSGHASLAFAFFTSIAVCLYIFQKNKKGFWLVLLAVLVSWSRIYLGVHSFLDVTAGATLGLLSVAIVTKTYLWYIKR